MTSGWQHFEHGADIGVEGRGNSLNDAFAQAALALTAVITDLDNVTAATLVEVDCEAPDYELLFVDWLNALIYEMANRHMLFRRFEVDIRDLRLHARVWGETIDVIKHQPTVEIKGATYTALGVRQDGDGIWHAQTVVDV
jgi:tRNA nucleotidyltransferase (CCA-adding enzyme)